MTQQTQTYDPFAAAMDPQEPANIVYGEFLVDVYFSVFQKGSRFGDIVFDPQEHSPRQRRTCIKLDIVPLPETNRQWDVSRTFPAESRKDGWLQVTLPSLREIGATDLKALHEKFVKAELVAYDTYINADGQERDLTAPKILAIYDTREECLQAYETDEPEAASESKIPWTDEDNTIDKINEDLYGVKPEDNGNGGAAAAADSPNVNGDAPVDEKQKEIAAGFIPGIVRNCIDEDTGTVDLVVLKERLEETPFLKDFFTVHSPEVLAEIRKVSGETAF